LSSESVEKLVNESTDRPPVSPEYVRSELTLHIIFFAMAAVVLLMSVSMRSGGDTAVYLPGFSSPMPGICTSRRVLGIDCPGCGMTRAFISISHGQLTRAWQLNPASLVMYLFVAVQIPWHGIQIWRLRNHRRPIQWNWVYLTPIGVVIMLMISWVWKLFQLGW
jgi:hypothetical protein